MRIWTWYIHHFIHQIRGLQTEEHVHYLPFFSQTCVIFVTQTGHMSIFTNIKYKFEYYCQASERGHEHQ